MSINPLGFPIPQDYIPDFIKGLRDNRSQSGRVIDQE